MTRRAQQSCWALALHSRPEFPLADESVKRIARRYYAERVVEGQVLPEQVKTSEWMAWLGSQPWFIRDPARLSENFPLAVKHLLTPQAYRQKLLLDLIAVDAEIGAGYRHLAEVVLRGLGRNDFSRRILTSVFRGS